MQDLYYTPEDIGKITGYKYGKCCDLIRKLNAQLEKEYPKTITLRGQIPKWYFDKKTMVLETIESQKNDCPR